MNILNIGVFAHIDAGKTTLTERLLFEAGVLRGIGSVDSGGAFTDFLDVEKRRGISVRDATVTFSYHDVTFDLIDTPGHADFFEETELALSAVDVAVIVISAREGVEAQTELLLGAVSRKRLPAVLFINKCDLGGARPYEVLGSLKNLKIFRRELLLFPSRGFPADDFCENAVSALGDEALLDDYLAGNLPPSRLSGLIRSACSSARLAPVLFGSAKLGSGAGELLELLCSYFSFPRDPSAPFSAFVYQVEHRKNVGKIAHVRLFSGQLAVRGECVNRRTGAVWKVAQIKRIKGEKYADIPALSAGETGALFGLSDVRAGDFLGAEPPVEPLNLFTPCFRVRVTPKNIEKLNELRAALGELTDESPSLALEWVSEKRELTVSASGRVQTEILKETLLSRYGLEADFGAPSVIYRETPARAGYGFEAYTMPKPCWAVVKFYIEPLPRGSGFVYESIAPENHIAYRYQEHVKTEVPRVLTQGLKGWQVTDLKVTLVDGEHHVQHTHPLDFFTATPMGIMDGLRNTGTILLEPVLDVRICGDRDSLGKVMSELALRRAKAEPALLDGDRFTLRADIPAEETFDLQERIMSLTSGRGSYSARLKGYYPCPEGHGAVRERVGVDPLDRSLWILHCRGAYKS